MLHLSPELTARVIDDPHVKFISFTGSVATGHIVAEEATKARGFKGLSLEVYLIEPAARALLDIILFRSSVARTRPTFDKTRILITPWQSSLMVWIPRQCHFLTIDRPLIGAFFNSGQSCCAIEVSDFTNIREGIVNDILVANLRPRIQV